MSKTHHSRNRGSSGERKPSVFERLGSKSAKNNAIKKRTEKEAVEKIVKSKDLDMKKVNHVKKGKEKQRNVHGQSSDGDMDLEGADEKFLQQRRLQLQRELRLQLKREKSTGAVKKPKKPEKKAAVSSSSASSSESSSSSSSSSSSYDRTKRSTTRKRKASVSSGSESSHSRHKKPAKVVNKPKIEEKRKPSPRKIEISKKIVTKKPASPNWDRRQSPVRKKSPPRTKARPVTSKPKPRAASPKKSKERRITPPARPPRPRSPDRRHRHSPRPRHGGLEKGGKILPVKSLNYGKDVRRKTPERIREEKEKERIKEKRRRELKIRETERREREREAERIKREAERQKERDEALARSRERQRERERLERIDREKRLKDYDRKEIETRKTEAKSDLPSLLDIKTEAPVREPARRAWDERRGRRPEDSFEFRHTPPTDDRRRGYDAKWTGEGRDPNWRDNYTARRTNERRSGSFTKEEEKPAVDPLPPRRPTEDNDTLIADVKDLNEALSDFSDDADDILNQEEPIPEPVVETTPTQLLPVALSQPSAEFFFDSRRPLLDCLNDKLDFEEISDEELEEDAKMSRGIMDVLGADWASLMSQTSLKAPNIKAASSARRRWCADSIISRIGISQKLAGQEFIQKYLDRIQSENDVTKEEPETISKPTKMDFLHTLPAVHAMLNEFSDQSPISRILNTSKHALSARSDLFIRRVACGFTLKESHQLAAIDENLYEANLMVIKSAAA